VGSWKCDAQVAIELGRCRICSLHYLPLRHHGGSHGVVLKTVQFVKEYLGKASIGWSNSKKKETKNWANKADCSLFLGQFVSAKFSSTFQRAALRRQAYNGLAKHIKTTWSTTRSRTPFPAFGNSSKLSMHDTGNDAVKYPRNLCFQILRKQDQTEVWLFQVWQQVRQRFFTVQQKNNHSGSTQSKGSTSEQKKSTTPNLSSKLGRMES